MSSDCSRSRFDELYDEIFQFGVERRLARVKSLPWKCETKLRQAYRSGLIRMREGEEA